MIAALRLRHDDVDARFQEGWVKAAERAADRDESGDHTWTEPLCAAISHDISRSDDEDIAGQRRELGDLAIEDRTAVHQQGAFVDPAEAARQTAGEDRCASRAVSH